MAVYEQDYLINGTSLQTTTQNQITNAGDLNLTLVSTEILTLRGTVYGGTTTSFTPIGEARVTIYDSKGTALASTTTVGTGTYTLIFEGTRNTQYTVVASATGYASNHDTVTFSNSQFAALSLLLSPVSNTNTIYGKVIDTNGDPISGAKIFISNGTNTVLVSTMNDGTFIAYDGFTAGESYTIIVDKLGYGETTQTIVYPADTNNYQVVLTLAPITENYTAIIGRITIAGSSPPVGLNDALVGLYLYNATDQTETLIANQKTDQFGNYAFTNVTGGNQYRIRAIRIVPVS